MKRELTDPRTVPPTPRPDLDQQDMLGAALAAGALALIGSAIFGAPTPLKALGGTALGAVAVSIFASTSQARAAHHQAEIQQSEPVAPPPRRLLLADRRS